MKNQCPDDSSQVSVSVIIATRNRTDLLERALRSVARQTWKDFEVIVVDDGSSADILEHHENYLRELGSRFRLEKPAVPGARGTGPAAARNRGIQLARGQFVAFIDDDDEWVSDRYLEVAVAFLRAHTANYFFGHLEGTRNGIAQDPGWVPPRELFANERVVADAPLVYEVSRQTILMMAQRFMVHPSNSVVSRATLLRIGGFFEGLWSHAEDLNLMLRILDRATRVLYFAETVTKYRLPSGDSISLTEIETMHFVQRILGAQQARLQCQTADMRKCARAREAWTYREMALHARALGQRADARTFALQALVTYPTLGALLFATRAAFGKSAASRPAIDGENPRLAPQMPRHSPSEKTAR
jgi:GT2 family glycosyltransferase